MAPLLHPTVVVGYGSHGLLVLQSLLISSASRGVLQWTEVRGGARPHERRLKDLVLLAVPDPYEADRGRRAAATEEDRTLLSLRHDLDQQIRRIEPGETDDTRALMRELLRASDILQGDTDRGRDEPQRRPGFDVILLAHLDELVNIGRLRALLDHALDELGNRPELGSRGQSAHRLNFIQILDFENYWNMDAAVGEVRRSLHDYFEHWEVRTREKKPSIGRTYVVDGHPPRGRWTALSRIEETVLFLQFLLFENQRAGDLGKLFDRSRDHQHPIGAFGIRVLERSSGLLGRLAAARFGVGWMDYLSGASGRTEAAPAAWRAFVDQVRSFSPAGAKEAARVGEAVHLAEARLEALGQELASTSPADEDWPSVVEARIRTARDLLAADLDRWSARQRQELDETLFADLPARIEAAVDAALHDDARPLPLGDVLADLEALDRGLQPAAAQEAPAEDEADALGANLWAAHRRYLAFLKEQVHPGRLARLWPLLALVLAAGLGPLVSLHLAALPRPDPTARVLTALHGLAQVLASPPLNGLLLFAGIWLLGHLVAQRGLAYRVERAHRFWTDPERGRLTDAVRRELGEGGCIREPLMGQLAERVAEAQQQSASELRREIRLVHDRLHQRRREMGWLKVQLLDFLHEHGLDAGALPEDGPLLGRRAGSVRYPLERTSDLDQIGRWHPPVAEQFRSLQKTERPFAGWNDEFSAAFLYPLVFLDKLSRQFGDPLESEQAEQDTGLHQARHAEDFEAFLRFYGQFGTGFGWPLEITVPTTEYWAVVPERWERLPSIRTALDGNRFLPTHTIKVRDLERAYLLCLNLGVEPADMRRPEER